MQFVIKKDGYVKIEENWLSQEQNAACVLDWIKEAQGHAGAEKCYVDELIAANPGTIDIEMALPANDGKKNALRMDLVVVEDHSPHPCLVFWEAKCADNSEARAVGKPKLVEQLGNYKTWMDETDHKTDVLAAYRNAAKILLELAEYFNKSSEPALAIWRNFANASKPCVLSKPGVVIGGYCPDGYDDKAGKIAKKAESLLYNGHKDRLNSEFGIEVVYHANSNEASKALPSLAGPSLCPSQ